MPANMDVKPDNDRYRWNEEEGVWMAWDEQLQNWDTTSQTYEEFEDGQKSSDINQDVDVRVSTGDGPGGGGPTGPPDVIEEDRQSWLDFITPANQTYQDLMSGINTPAEDAITSGVQGSTNRLMEGLASRGTVGSGMEFSMKQQIERAGTGEMAKSRLATMMAGAQGQSQLGSTYASLLHRQRPVGQFSDGWSRKESDLAREDDVSETNARRGEEDLKRRQRENEDEEARRQTG